MRLNIVESKNASQFYVIKSTYENKKNSSVIVEKLGTLAELQKTHADPVAWAKEYVAELNRLDKENKRTVLIKYSPNKNIEKDAQRLFNGADLFLKKIYLELGLDKICKEISKKYRHEFNLDSILSRLVFSRIVFPASKKATLELSKKFIEQPDFALHDIYRSLEVFAKESDFISSQVYQNSLEVIKRQTGVIYYDCTNFFFEIEEEDELRKYGLSKEHRPNPIVQMGLFMDSEGIPLAFCINPGNTNEQTTLQPLEQKLIDDFGISKFVVCTDAGLCSMANRKFNDKKNRAFITTQPIKKLKKHIREWTLDPKGWKIEGSNERFDITNIIEEDFEDSIFYKERWVNEDGLDQKLIVTYSLKYRNYARHIRNKQIERAKKLIEKNPTKLGKVNANDFKRFVSKTSVTPDGEVADKNVLGINYEIIANEERYDGFYAVTTNLVDSAGKIIAVNRRRWEIEECFRIMKSEFKSRPVYVSREDRIKAHFMTCFLSLLVYRLLEKKLQNKYTCEQIIKGLRDMSFLKTDSEGFIPAYTRNDFTDDLHETFGFRTDFEIVSKKMIKNILKK